MPERRFAPLDLAGAVHQSIATLRSAGRLARHALTVSAAPVWIHGDGNRIEQMVAHLVNNAVKFTPPGGAIAVTVASEDRHALLTVRDRGAGMEAQRLRQLLDPSVQEKNGLDRAREGPGNGLMLVRQWVELHGGTLSASSDGPSLGSAFSIRLPAVAKPAGGPDPAQTAEQPPGNAPRPGEAGGAQRVREILLVEDSADAREMMRMLLVLDGHVVHQADDGPGGAAAGEGRAFDIAFIDVGLPLMDGYEVARRIRAAEKAQNRAPMRLVALTGYGQPGDRALALEAGFDLHLIKPVETDTIVRVLAELPARAPVP